MSRWTIHTERFDFFHRPAGAVAVDQRDGIEIVRLADASSPVAPELDFFCQSNGFGEGWASQMLTDRARAAVAKNSSGDIMAMGWITAWPFTVDEMDSQIILKHPDPARPVHYLFGDFTSPAHRGQKLQALLVNHRLQWCAQIGDGQALTIIEPANLASIKSYQKLDFKPIGRVSRKSWLGKHWVKVRARSSPPGLLVRNRSIEIQFD